MEAKWRIRTDASPKNDVQEWVPRRRRLRAIEAVPDTVGVKCVVRVGDEKRPFTLVTRRSRLVMQCLCRRVRHTRA